MIYLNLLSSVSLTSKVWHGTVFNYEYQITETKKTETLHESEDT